MNITRLITCSRRSYCLADRFNDHSRCHTLCKQSV